MKPIYPKYFLVLWVCTLMLSGCVATTGPVTPPVDVKSLHLQLQALPGAVVDLKTMTVAYPGDALFASGAVLPFPGGMEVLDPLIIWILQSDEIIGEAFVRSTGHAEDYDRVLSEKRRELLVQLFKNRGVMPAQLKFLVDENAGPPLELRFHLRSSTISSGGNA